ncbi:hypothetical protein DL96DRAFT_1627053, partial [Flagelloscypha sp. PMI_526]
MAADTTGLASIFSKEPLPLEIIMIILDFSLQDNSTYDIMFRFSLLSRGVHRWILPRLYHTLDLEMESVPPHQSRAIDRVALLATANPLSFLFTRRIISRLSKFPFNATLFSNLSHLALWGHNYLGGGVLGEKLADDIVMLPLEELFVWEESDSDVLLGKLSADATMWMTLRRLGCHSRTRRDLYRGWFKCPSLVQVLQVCDHIVWFIENGLKSVVLPPSPKFKSLIITPLMSSIKTHPLIAGGIVQSIVKDPRVVILVHPPHHFF